MKYTFDQFLKLFTLQKNISFEDFSQRLAVLNGSDTSGQFVVRSSLDVFVDRVAKKDDRKAKLDQYKRNLYRILVTDAENSLKEWFRRNAELVEDLDYYFDIPDADIFDGETFGGRTLAKYGRICKNINFENFYTTKKLYSNDFEYTFGLLKAMFEDFKIRNSLVGPAFFDHIYKLEDDYGQFWTDFNTGCNRASIFNPVTYRGILDEIFTGETVFAPVMGWNAYQVAFYNSGFKKFIATDVIPEVVDNGRKLHTEWQAYRDRSLFEMADRSVDLYLCPSEELEAKHDFVNRYRNTVDAVLFSPPYYDLEIYPGEEQSFTNYPDYQVWLEKYWEATVKLCKQVMKPGAKFGFVISNYRNKAGEDVTISQDMRAVAEKHLTFDRHYKVQWSAIGGSRQAKKTRDGNFEDLWVFVR